MEPFLPVLLILAGLALLAAEVHVAPGSHVLGAAGVLVAGAGVALAFAGAGPAVGLAALAGTLVGAGGLFYGLWRSGAWERFVLRDTLGRDPASDEADDARRAQLLGRTGVAISSLRPEGVVEVEGARVEAATEGAYVAAGSRVRVVAVDRQRRYVVRLAEEAADAGR